MRYGQRSTVRIDAKQVPFRDDGYAERCEYCIQSKPCEAYTIGRAGGFGRCNTCGLVYPVEMLNMIPGVNDASRS